MIRTELHRISKRPYAVRLDSLLVETDEQRATRWHRVLLAAAWFRRRDGRTVAVIGHLSTTQRDPAPRDAVDALQRYHDGRYGGRWVARWDGTSYVSEHPQSPEAMAQHLTLLRPMLDNYPDVPPGYDGWWSFTA